MKAKNDTQWRTLATSVTSQVHKPKSEESHDVTWWRDTTALVRVNGYIIWGFLVEIDNWDQGAADEGYNTDGCSYYSYFGSALSVG